MGAIKVILSEELEQEFREEVFKKKGMKKGNLTEAIVEAITLWINDNQKKRSQAAKKAWETRRKQN